VQETDHFVAGFDVAGDRRASAVAEFRHSFCMAFFPVPECPWRDAQESGGLALGHFLPGRPIGVGDRSVAGVAFPFPSTPLGHVVLSRPWIRPRLGPTATGHLGARSGAPVLRQSRDTSTEPF